MATFKATVQEHHKKADGSYNVKIRVTHQRKIRYLATSVYVFKEDMTRSLKIKDQDTIDLLDNQIKLYYNDIKELGGSIAYLDVDDIVKHIQQCDKKRAEAENPRIDFYAYVDTIVEKIRKEGRRSTADNYVSMKNSLIKFYGPQLYFSDINVAFLKEYQNHLIKPDSNSGYRALSAYTGLIRAVFNVAMGELNDEENDIIKIKYSPFGKGKYIIPKEPEPKKRAIPLEKVVLIKNMNEYELYRANLAKDVFMLSFYLCGINSADLFNCDKLEKGRITYKRAKTSSRRKDKAKISIKIPEEAQALFDKYKDATKKRVFRFYQMYADKGTFNAAINIGLKTIGKDINIDDLEYYAARHTFGSTARNRCKLSRDYVASALNHSLPEYKVTDTYIEEDWSIVDDVQDKVIKELIKCENALKNKK